MELDGIKESRGIAGRIRGIRGFNVRNLGINWKYAVIPNHVDHNPEWRTPRASQIRTPSTRVTRPMRSYNHPSTTELAKCSWAGTQTISSLVRKIDLNVLNTWLAKQELPVRRSGPVCKIDIPGKCA